MQHPTFLAVVVAIAALSGAAEAVQTDLDGLVVDGCNATIATAIADSDDYDDCYKQSGFTFDLSLSSTTDEDDFCTSRECLSVFRALRKQKVLECAIVDGLEEVPLTEGAGQIACFGVPAVTTNSTVIIRPPKGSASGSSGSGSQTPEPTTTPPTITPTTDTPEPTTPKPTTTKPGSDSGSGSRSIDPIVSPSPIASSSSSMDTTTIVTIVGICVGVLVVLATLWCAAVRTKKKKKKKKKKNRRSKHMRPTEADYYGSDHQPTAAQYYASASPTVRLSQQHRGTRGTASHMTWQTGAAGVSSAFAGWDEELIAAVRIPYEKLSFDQLISRGGYGEVYRGRYRGQVVAIKTLLPERRRDMRQIQRFLSEVKMMAAMEHDRIRGIRWKN
nr:elicitin-like protein [Pythium porphyrae]